MSKPTAEPLAALRDNPGGWPPELLPLFERAITVEFASLTRAGTPVTFPLTPYVGEDGRTLDVSTGLSYPAKAERARRNPKVALLYADPLGSGLSDPPVALVQGLATVRDADLQGNTDRFLRLSLTKLPTAYQGQPKFLLRRLSFSFARIWIQVTPTRILWWPGGRLEEPFREWVAPAGTEAPPSDPAPKGKQAGAWIESPTDWRQATTRAAVEFQFRDLTVVGTDGFPVCLPVERVTAHPEGFRLRLARGLPTMPEGAACLTFHRHTPDLSMQENLAFVGHASGAEENLLFRVERQLGDWSLAGSKLGNTLDFVVRKRRALKPRLQAEAARRGQPVPRIRFPGEY